jgi:4-hydroxybenzoyl-CoA reductase subunit alpha
MREFSVIGKRIPRVDGVVKVTGEARYAGDMSLARMLYGKILRSPYPHARIMNIDTDKAKRLSGVKGVITGQDTLGVKYITFQLLWRLADDSILAMDKVRFIGDEVAAVAAIDEDIAEEALDLITVEYEELPAVFDPEEALKEDAPQIHDHAKGNVGLSRLVEFGDLDRAFKECDYIREDRFVTSAVIHGFMEPHACVAGFDPAGRLTIWTSTQSPYAVQTLLAKTLGMREGDIRVIRPHVGGGFGGKVEMLAHEFCSALLSKKTGRPVRIEYTRDEEFSAGRRRHPMTIELKTGVKKDGTLVARECRNMIDGGAYLGLGGIVVSNSITLPALTYRVPNYRYQAHRVYTNKPPGTAMRGFGAPQPVFALESHLDMIAENLGIDPVELRLRNSIQSGDQIPRVAKISTCGLSECIQKAANRAGWDGKQGKLPRGRGMGIACYGFASGALFNIFNSRLPYSEVQIKLNDDGTVNLLTQAADIGQGSDTVLCQIVAEELGVKVEDVTITASDTQNAPMDLGSFSSRVTLFAGNAAMAAAADVKRQLFEVASGQLGLKMHQHLEARDRRIFIREHPEKGISFSETVQVAQRAKNGMPVMGRGIFDHRKSSGFGSPTWSFGAQVAEVEVDRETGHVTLLKITAAHDCGKALNPLLVEGQLEGSIHMGMGYALSEEILFDKGLTLNPSSLDYKIPLATHTPEIETIEVETNDPEGPFGAKESGEGLTLPVAPAIANAIYAAVGARVKELPITPDKILKALEEREGM